MAEINDTQLPALADRNMDLNQGVSTIQEDLFNRPWKNDTHIPVPSLPTGEPAAVTETDKIGAWFTDNSNDDNAAYNAFSYENTRVDRRDISDYDKNRYDYFYPGRTDQEDIAARQQGTGERIAKSVANMVPRFTHTLVESVTGPLVGVGYLMDGNKSTGFADNPYSKWLESWGQGYDIYESDARKNASWWSPTYWASANSLNGVLGTVGDLAAFYVTGMGAGKLIGAMSKPVGAMLGNQYNRALQGVAEFSAVVPEGAEGKIAVKELTESLARIKNSGMADAAKMESSLNTIAEASKKYANSMKTFNKFQQAAAGTVTNLGMAQSSAYQASEGFKQRAIQKIQEEGRTPTQAELDEIDEIAGEVATTTGIAMTIMGATTLHGLLKGSIAKKEGEQLIRNEINEIEQIGVQKAVVGEVPLYGLKPKVPLTATTKLGKVGERIGRAAMATPKFLKNNIDVWPAVGFLEFGAVPASIDSYYEKKYEDDGEWTGQEQAEAFTGAVGTNVENIFSKEGASSFFTGLFAGNLGVGGGVYRKLGQRKAVRENTTAALKALNETYAQSYLKSSVNSAKRGQVLRKNYLEAIKEGDKDKEMTLRQQQWENYLYPRIKYGLKSFVDKDIDSYRKVALTDEGIRQLQEDNIIEQGDNMTELRAKFTDHLNYMQDYATRAEKYYQGLTLKYGGYIGTDGKPLYNDEHIEKLMVLSGGIDDVTRRIGELSDQIKTSKLSDDPKFQQRFAGLLQHMEALKAVEPFIGRAPKAEIDNIFKQIDNLSMNPGERDELAQKFADLMKLNVRKKQYLAQYEDITRNPQEHSDTVTENAVPTEVEPGKKITGIKTKNKQPMDLEVGQEYYAGERIVPGKSPEGTQTRFRKFSRFTVIGEKVDENGKRSIVVRNSQGQEQTIPESAFQNYKLGKVADVEKNHNAKYFLNNINSVYEYKLPNGEKVNGRLKYDHEEDEFSFVYRDPKTGEQRETVVTKDQFRDKTTTDKQGGVVSYAARLKKVGTITEADKEWLETKATERENAKQARLVRGKIDVIDKLVKDKLELKKEVEDKMLDKMVELEEVQKKLADIPKIREERTEREDGKIRQTKLQERTKYFKEDMKTLTDTANTLTRTITDLEKSIETLQENADNIQSEIEYIQSLDISDLPTGEAVIKFFADNRQTLEEIQLDKEIQVEGLQGIIQKAKDILNDIVSYISDKIRKFTDRYPGAPTVDDSTLRDYLNEQRRSADYPDGKIFFTPFPDLISDLRKLNTLIADAEEIDIAATKSEIADAEKQITQLHAEISDLQKTIKVNNELYKAFSDKLAEFRRQEQMEKLLDSPEGRTKLRLLQGRSFDQSYVPQVEPTDQTRNFQPAAKPIDTVWYSGVLPSHGQHSTDHSNWSDRYNNFLTNSNLDFQEPVQREEGAKYLSDDPNYRGKMKVIVVTRQNQHHYFPEGSEFIAESYADGKEKNTQDNPSKASVAFIHVYKDTDGFKFVDQYGKVLGKVGDKDADPNQVVFIRMETAELERAGGFEKFYTPKDFTEEEIKYYKETAKQQRARILENTSVSGFYDYKESLGIPNYAKKPDGKIIPVHNSVTDAKLVPETKIGSGVIRIPTIQGEKITAGANSFAAPIGQPILVHENNVAYLNPKKFYRTTEEGGDNSTKEVDHLYKVIKALAESRRQKGGAIEAVYVNYIKGVLFMGSKKDAEKGISDNQLYIDADNTLGAVLAFKLDGKPEIVKFTPEDIEDNKELFKKWLKQTFHAVDAKKLKAGGKWLEITKVNHDEKGDLIAPTTKEWANYEQYLLSGKDGRTDIPLTTNIKVGTEPWDGPFMNKYIVPEFNDDYFPKPEFKTPEVAEVKEPAKSVTGKETIIYKDKPVALDGSVNKNTGKSTSLGEFTYDYKATVEGEQVKVTVENFKNDPAKPEAGPDTIKALEASLSKVLSAEYKVQKKDVVEEVKLEPVKQEVKSTPEQNEEIEALIAKANSNVKLGGRVHEDLMEVVPDEVINSKFDKEAFDEYLKATTPQIEFETLPHFIKTGRGTNAWGAYQNHYIKLHEGAPAGTEFHEHYHAVEDSFLSPREIGETRVEFRNRKGSYVDRFGNTIEYAKATERQIREKLAEEYRSFKGENPQFTQGSKIGRFFQKLWNFIKHVVLGRPTKVQEIFKRINSSYYRDTAFTKPADTMAEYSEMKGMSEVEKKWILHGLFERVIATLRSNGDITRISEMTADEIFEPLMESMKDYYTNADAKSNIWLRMANRVEAIEQSNLTPEQKELAKEYLKNEATGAYEIWSKVSAEKEAVIKDLRMFMRKFKLDFKRKQVDVENEDTVKEQKEQEQEQGINDDVKDRDYSVEYLSIDPVKAADLEVRLLFSALTYADSNIANPNRNAQFGYNDLKETPSKLTPLLLPELVDSGKYMYSVLDTMAGITNPEAIQERLFDMAKKDPNLVRLYNTIYKEPKTERDWQLRVSFTKFATKVKPDYKFTEIDEEGNAIVKNSNSEADARSIVQQWQSDLRGDNTGLVVIGNDGLYRADTTKLVKPDKEKGTLQFLQQIRFPVDDTLMVKLSAEDKTSLINESAKLYSELTKKGSPLKVISRKQLDISAIGKIARILAKVHVYTGNTSHNNMDNNRVQNYTMYNAITRMMADINNTSTLKELKEKFPRYNNDTFIAHSVLLKPDGPIYDASGRKKDFGGDEFKFNMAVIEGLKNSRVSGKSQVSTGDMNEVVRAMNSLNMNLGAHGMMTVANFVAADSKTEAGTTVPYYIKTDEFKDTTLRKKVFGEAIIGYLADEINIIKENLSGDRELLSGALENENYKKLQVFKDILPKELVQEITEHANNPKESTDKYLVGIKGKVDKAVEKYLNDQIEEELSQFIDRKVVTPKGNEMYRWWGLNKETAKELGIDVKKMSIEQAKDILRFRDMNLFMHLTEMRKLFFGPWYEVPDAFKRDKLLQSGTTNTYHGDEAYNSWHTANQLSGKVTLQAGDAMFHNYREVFNQMTVAEIKSRSKLYPGVDIEEMDGQGITIDAYWKEYKKRSGDRWTDADEAQHQYDMAAAREAHYKRYPEQTYRKELKQADKLILDKGNPHTEGTGTPLKPVGVGMQASETQSMPYADKTSIMRLTYPIAKERGLEDLYWFMKEHDIAMVGPKSWQKYGRKSLSDTKNELPELYKMEGDTAKFALSDLTPEQIGKVSTQIPWNTFNKIVETAKSKEGKTRATQPLSLITVNGHESGIPVDVYNSDKDDLADKEKYWNTLTNAEKRERSPLYRMWEDHNKAVAERSYRGYEAVLDKLGITEGDNKYTFKYPQKTVEYLRNEITRRDLPDNVAEGLDWVYDETLDHDVLKYPLEALANYQQLNTILWSLADKEILSPRMNGTDNILTSSGLMEGRGIRKVTQENGKSYLASSELKFYEKGKDGTSLMEVYAPNHLAKKLKKFGSQLTDIQLMDYLNNTEEGQKLLRGIGFRIPTQGMNFIDAFRIKPWSDTELFLPAEMGNSVIVPSEIVTKVGADFDVDKMGTYHFNFYVDDKGYPRIIDFIEDTTSEEGLEKLYEQRKKLSPLDTEETLLGDTNWKSHKDLAISIQNAEREIGTITKFIAENKGKDPWKLNSTEAIENKYFETMLELITHSSNFEQLVTPNSSEEMLKVFREITNDLYPDKQGRDKSDVNYSNLLKPMFLNKERQDYRDATGNSIGIGAQNNTFHAQSQLAYIPVSQKILLPHKQITYNGRKQTVLSGTRNDAGSYISDFISQIINGAVDAVKDKWLIEMLQNKSLLGTATFLGRIGAAPRQVFMFLNQPIIQEFIKQEGIYRDVRLLNTALGKKYQADFEAMARKNLGIMVKKTQRDTNFTIDEMKEVLVATGKKQPLTAKQKEMQSQVLDEFIKYRELADVQMVKNQVAFLTANMPRIHDAAIVNKSERVDKAMDSTIPVMDKLNNKTFHSDILKMLTNTMRAKGLITPISAHPALRGIMEVATDTRKFLTDEARYKFFQEGVTSLLNYSSQVMGNTKINKFIKPLLITDETSVAKKLMSAKRQAKGDMKRVFDVVLSTLQPDIPLDNTQPKNVKLTRKPATGVEADMITEAFRALRDNPTTNNLYKELVVQSFLQNGNKAAFGSYHSYIPAEDTIKYMKPIIDRVLSEPVEAFEENKVMYRNNWNNTDIVPLKPKTDDGVGNMSNRTYEPEQLSEYKNTKFMTLHTLYDGNRINYPVIQVRDYSKNSAGELQMHVKLFQKVLGPDGEPVVTGKDDKGKSYLYKQINAWGDGNRAQEYYDILQSSVLAMHEKVTEVPDSELSKKFGGNTMKSQPDVVSSRPMGNDLFSQNKGTYTGVKRVISGAQTGVDIAGLDAALESNIPTGGTAAAKFTQSTAKGTITNPELATKYGLKEGQLTRRKGQYGDYDDVYIQRTVANAQEADGTIWFGNEGSPGGILTLKKSSQEGKAKPLINPKSAAEIKQWLSDNQIETVNIAGNREHTNPGIYEKSKQMLKEAFKKGDSKLLNVQVKPNEKGEYNIYAGTNENSVLSNMTPRKFIYNGAEFESVEQAFQESKLQYTKGTAADIATHKKIAESTNAYDAKKFGREYKTLDTVEWDKNSSKMMKIFIKASLEQNPEVLKNLLATGEIKLTHAQDTGKWGKEFPRILTELRKEMRAPGLFTAADIKKVKDAKRDC